jgi:hypothetical protein
MSEFKLKENQAALILESSDNGEIGVNIAISEEGAENGVLATALCQVIAKKLIEDEQFQNEIMSELDDE